MEPPSHHGLTVAVAINGKKKSGSIILWALDKFVLEENVRFKLLHIRPRITTIPTPMGVIPISEVRDNIAATYKQEMEWKANEMIHPFKRIFIRRKVEIDVIMIESSDVAHAIAEEITRYAINKLVIGASSRGFLSRKNDMSSIISASTSNFCTVYVVSKGKLLRIRPSDTDTSSVESIKEDNNSERSSSTNCSPEFADVASVSDEFHPSAPPLAPKILDKRRTINKSITSMDTSSVGTNNSGSMSLDSDERNDAFSYPESYGVGHQVSMASTWRDFDERREARSSTSSNPDYGQAVHRSSSWTSMLTDNQSRVSHQTSNFSDALTENSSSEVQVNLSFEIEKLKSDLKHVQEIYALAQTETMDASRKLNELNHRQLEEALRLEQLKLKEKEAKMLARKEKENYVAARKKSENAREHAQKVVSRRQEETWRKNEGDAQNFEGSSVQYEQFTWEEIAVATSSFSEDLRIGAGAYGIVYKCIMHHTTAAVKVLHSSEASVPKHFQQELEILSKIRHPHLLLLIGACPERGCLVYEYMENGSLEDRLLQLNNTPPIPWFERFRIAWEVASALVFLHRSKPKPIIHRDLKPANILLDHNFVSKVGDVGLSTMLQLDPTSNMTIYKETSPVGTLCYIDPEYQRTGVVTPKSDVYSFGMIILQLLTAKPALAVTRVVERAVKENNLLGVLDSKAGDWPVEETLELASLGLCCTELRRRDRPDLEDQILPALEKFKKLAEFARGSFSRVQVSTPGHFICPILQDVMNEPCVASDGYTYDRKAIEEWLETNDTSPMTKLPMPNKNLLANYSLCSAISEWKSRT